MSTIVRIISRTRPARVRHRQLTRYRVYTLGAEGDLICLPIADGTVVWSRDLPKDYGFETPTWGCASHPLVDGQKLVCLVGGQGSIAVAFDKHTGREL